MKSLLFKWWFWMLLLLAGSAYWWSQQQKMEHPIPRPFLDVDTSRLSVIVIDPDGKAGQPPYKLFRDDSRWKVGYQSQRWYAKTHVMHRMLRKLATIQPDQLVARDASAWPQYGLVPGEAYCIRLLWMHGQERQERMFWLGYQDIRNQKQAITYIRRAGDSAVYAVPAYYGTDLMGEPEDWMADQQARDP